MEYYAVVKNMLWQSKIDTSVSIGTNMKIYSTLSAVGFMVTTLIHTIHWIAAESRGEANGCPANSSWIPKEQSCYFFLQESVNFTQAKGGCEGLGAHLVSIGSEEENQFIVDFVGTLNLPIWIGLFRTTTDICAGSSCGSWVWLDGSDQSYTRWATGILPNSIQCVFMVSQGDWDHGRFCSAQRGYVCEQKRIFQGTTSESVTTMSTTCAIESREEADGCPANSCWTPKSTSCYLYLHESVNFTQAKDGCEGLGAHLVSIGSEEENQFIVDFGGYFMLLATILMCMPLSPAAVHQNDIISITNLPIWIGLFRTTTEICAGNSCRSWMWLDGSDVGYSQWATGIVPNSIQCAFMIFQGNWDHGRFCSEKRGYVCEQKRIFPDTTPHSTTTEFLDSYTSGMAGDVDSTTDTTMKNDDPSSTYVIIGVVAAIVVSAAFLGVLVYCIKTRRRNERKMSENGAISHTPGVSTGSGVYENYGVEAFHGLTEGHDLVCVNSVHLNTVTREDAAMRTIRYNEATGDQPAYEDLHVYEKVNNYSEINPEYTQLKSVRSNDNPETTQDDVIAMYANVER